MKRDVLCLVSALLVAPAHAEPMPPSRQAALLLAEVHLLEGEAQYAFEVAGKRGAACRLWAQAQETAAESYKIYPSEATATAPINSAIALQQHCQDLDLKAGQQR